MLNRILLPLLLLTLLGSGCSNHRLPWNSAASAPLPAADQQPLSHATVSDDKQFNERLISLLQDNARLQQSLLVKSRQALDKSKAIKDERKQIVEAIYQQLLTALGSEIARGDLTISRLGDQLSIDVSDRILFDSGKIDLKSGGQKALKTIGEILQKYPHKGLLIAGHTDNLKIRPRLQQRYPSNWELSTARATRVVRYLQEKAGLPGERLLAAGYGPYHPLASNETEQGRAKNRRIQILLIDSDSPLFSLAGKE